MELDVIFSRELHKKLKERIKGKVFCKVFDDNFATRVCYGLSTDYILYEVIEKYERFLINRVRKYYFKG